MSRVMAVNPAVYPICPKCSCEYVECTYIPNLDVLNCACDRCKHKFVIMPYEQACKILDAEKQPKIKYVTSQGNA